jgi:hypothetical protein
VTGDKKTGGSSPPVFLFLRDSKKFFNPQPGNIEFFCLFLLTILIQKLYNEFDREGSSQTLQAMRFDGKRSV